MYIQVLKDSLTSCTLAMLATFVNLIRPRQKQVANGDWVSGTLYMLS